MKSLPVLFTALDWRFRYWGFLVLRPICSLLVAGLTVTLFLGVTSVRLNAAEAQPANILFIHMEDMGVQIPVDGDHTVATPNLDRLAAEGIVFERAHVVAATCAASRGALFSGLHPHQNGIMGFIDPNDYGWAPQADPQFER